jgi:hypothetical protein
MIRMTRQLVEVVDAMRKIGEPTTIDLIVTQLGMTRRETDQIGARLQSYRAKGLVIKTGTIPGPGGCVGMKALWKLNEQVAATISSAVKVRKESGAVPSKWEHEALTEAMRNMNHSEHLRDIVITKNIGVI